MSGRLSFRIFAHSWTSDWNHGNAHFLRGLAQELTLLGHQVRCYEERDSWSRVNLRQEGPAGERALNQFKEAFPQLDVRHYRRDTAFVAFARQELRGADIVLVHEWNHPEVVNTLLAMKDKLGFRILFHDTHHRAYTRAGEILKFNLREFDAVLAFGEAIRKIYVQGFGIKRAWTLHEAADTAHFRPQPAEKNTDVIWVGNWGDEERTAELEEFLIQPAAHLHRKFAVYGVRYPQPAQARLSSGGIEYRGYLANLETPGAYGRSLITLHVPRRFYLNGLSGVPTIRVFESLACGIPLLSAPWTDTDGLFSAGEDYLSVADGRAMEAEMRHLLADQRARDEISAHGLKTIREKHTCRHRALQLLEICEELGK